MQNSHFTNLSQCVDNAKKYIDQNFATIKSIRQITDSVGANYNNLRAKFRRETGQTLGEYLMFVRLEAARAMITETDLFVKEIAWKVGINDESYFCKRFRERYGVTMIEYRERSGVGEKQIETSN